MANNLYKTDYEQWLENQAIALKERKPDLLDWDNLLELSEMGNPKDVVESNLVIRKMGLKPRPFRTACIFV